MAKYYFTYGSDRHYPYPYQNGYTEVIADNIHKAVRLFNFVHPKRAGSDCANCAFYYSEEEWGAVDENVKKRLLCLEQIRTGYFAPDPETVPEEYVVAEPLVNNYVIAGHLGEKPWEIFAEKDNDRAKEVTTLHSVRMDGYRTDRDVFVRVLHDQGINVLDAIDRCFTEWYKTKEGREAWEYSCGDFNIGDILSGGGPGSEFTKRFGFEFLPHEADNVIEISYDRVLGDGDICDEE